jgi:hypothetical protein
MFQICVLDQKVQGKKGVMLVNIFKNAMIRIIKIHNILDIIEISKSMKLNKCIQIFFYENVHSLEEMLYILTIFL